MSQDSVTPSPPMTPASASHSAPSAPQSAAADQKTILVVEDNELNMKLFHDLLTAHGYATVETSDGAAVLDLARDHRPDLIVMDIHLPGADGKEITGQLKADPDLAPIPVVAVTAFAMKGDREGIMAAGCQDYISKPITMKDFIDTIRRHTGG